MNLCKQAAFTTFYKNPQESQSLVDASDPVPPNRHWATKQMHGDERERFKWANQRRCWFTVPGPTGQAGMTLSDRCCQQDSTCWRLRFH